MNFTIRHTGQRFFQTNFLKDKLCEGIFRGISGINVTFFSPETIIASPRSESLFYVRVRNPEIKIGCIPKLKIAHGIYLGDTIVENVSGKAYLNVKHVGRRSRRSSTNFAP